MALLYVDRNANPPPPREDDTDLLLMGVSLTRYFFGMEERPDDILFRQLRGAHAQIGRLVQRPLQLHQEAALVCLASDVEAGWVQAPTKFRDSFLISAVNKGMFQMAAAEFYSFCYNGYGRVNARAWQKRRAEHYLFVRGHLLFDGCN